MKETNTENTETYAFLNKHPPMVMVAMPVSGKSIVFKAYRIFKARLLVLKHNRSGLTLLA